MAKRFLASLRLANLSSDPQSADNGDIYYNSSNHKVKVYQNGSWNNLPSLLEDLNDVSASGVSNGQVLTYNGTSSQWEAESVPPSATATGTSFPQNPSDGEFFFNTDTEKLYFFYITWNEIAFTTISLDGGTSYTTEFEGTFDGGDSATTDFNSGTYNAGNAFTTY